MSDNSRGAGRTPAGRPAQREIGIGAVFNVVSAAEGWYASGEADNATGPKARALRAAVAKMLASGAEPGAPRAEVVAIGRGDRQE